VSRAPASAEGADFLVAAGTVVDLVGRMEVVGHWSDPSALPGLTVAGLAAHLCSQVLSVHAAVTAGTAVTEERPVPLLEHFGRVPWVGAGPDHPANVAIREGSERSAGVGHGALVASVQTALQDLRPALTGALPAGLPPAIRLPPWQWALSFDDFLVTRVMEIVVHSDDLAVSVGVEPPILPEAVLGPVLALLVGVSLQRHGQAAVVRALSRSERAPGSISAL
jgi:hypothetical protein